MPNTNKKNEERYKLGFGFVTPSYAPDFERCSLLCRSIDRYVAKPFTHYLVVDRDDFSLFKGLASENRVVLEKQAVLPRWLWQVPYFKEKNLWLNRKGWRSGNIIVRGWIVQQLVKLLSNRFVDEEVIVFADSDTAFIRDFNPQEFVDDEGRVRLFSVQLTTNHDTAESLRWKKSARRLLGVPEQKEIFDLYISQIVTWRKSELDLLQRHVESTTGREFVSCVCDSKHLAEYILYGVYISYIRGGDAAHFHDHQMKLVHCNWSDAAIDQGEIREFIEFARADNYAAVMISAKSGATINASDIFDHS